MNTSLISLAFSFLYLRGCSSQIDKWKTRDSGLKKKWLEVLVLDEFSCILAEWGLEIGLMLLYMLHAYI